MDQNIPDLDLVAASLAVLVDVDVNGEMGIDVAHLVLETLGDTNNQVVDEGSDRSQSSDILADTVVNLNANDVLLRLREADSDMTQVLGELAYFQSSLRLDSLRAMAVLSIVA
jgi:hypothetical protein